jgi:hypothetical protein
MFRSPFVPASTLPAPAVYAPPEAPIPVFTALENVLGVGLSVL